MLTHACSFDLTFHIALPGSAAVEMEGGKFCSCVAFGLRPFGFVFFFF